MPGFSDDYLMTALGAAMEAGKAILKVYRKPVIRRELKKDASPVTEADRNAHAIIAQRLNQTGLPVLSEEGKKTAFAERKNWSSFWLVDPLDGTKEFIRKSGDFTVNIALVNHGTPVLGIVYTPLHDLLHFGERDSGAFRVKGLLGKWPGITCLEDLMGITESLPVEQKGSAMRVVASRSHRNRQTNRYIKSLKRKHPELEFLSRGSALKFCLVAEGSADIYPRFSPTWEWDTGAGHAVAEAAGCRVTLLDETTPLNYNKKDLLNPGFIVKGSAVAASDTIQANPDQAEPDRRGRWI
jgi:3'(2'), 5'-bisphosphate nucleotidase